MRRTRVTPFALLSLLILSASCSGGSEPTAPSSSPGLTGKWSGTLSLRGGLDAGQPVTLDLVELDGRVSGTMGDWESITWNVSGDERLLSATRIPATSTCSALALSVESVEERSGQPVALSGALTGRCYGTALGRFRFVRK